MSAEQPMPDAIFAVLPDDAALADWLFVHGCSITVAEGLAGPGYERAIGIRVVGRRNDGTPATQMFMFTPPAFRDLVAQCATGIIDGRFA